MKRFFLILTLGCISAALHAQPYRPIPDSLRCEYIDAYAEHGSQEYFDLNTSFDRVYNGDSIFFVRKRCYEMGDMSYDWGLGSTMKVLATPHHYILTKFGYDYLIRTNYVQGSSWTMNSDFGSLIAKFQDKTLEDVLGVQDSVITIALLDQAGQSKGSMRLSKHFGIVFFENTNAPFDEISMSLVSIPALNMGTTVLDLPTMFHYNTGDVLYYQESQSITYGGQTVYKGYIRMKVAGVTTDADTTFYTLEFTSTSGNSFGTPQQSCVFAVSPEKTWIESGTAPMYFVSGVHQYSLPFCSASMRSLAYFVFTLSDEDNDNLPEFHDYTSGEFGPGNTYVFSYTSGFYAYRYYYAFANTSSGEPDRKSIEFLKRFDASVSNPDEVFFSTLSTTASENVLLKIYPVPCHNELHLELPSSLEKTHIQISDLSGRIIMEYAMDEFSGTESISVATLHKGSYLLQISSDNEVYRQLFLKE